MTTIDMPIEQRRDVPDEIWAATNALLSPSPPSNPVVTLKTAEWWYHHGRGVNDPAFKYAIRWLDYSHNDNIQSEDMDMFSDLREYLDELK